MQYIQTKSNRIPICGIMKNSQTSLQIQFKISELDQVKIQKEDIENIFSNSNETKKMELKTAEDLTMNTYLNYSKLDSVECRYNVLTNPEDPKESDTVVTIVLYKKTDAEIQLDETSELVDAITIALAEMMGV